MPGSLHVVDVLPVTGEEPRVFVPQDPLTDKALADCHAISFTRSLPDSLSRGSRANPPGLPAFAVQCPGAGLARLDARMVE